MKQLDYASSALMFIGAINWGLIGLFDFDLIHFFLDNSWMDNFIYTLIGVSAIYRAVQGRLRNPRMKED